MDKALITPGTFVVGCNYWASHAGTAMWSDWRPDIVEKDLKTLAQEGLQILRVFPLWPDFQPLTLLRTGHGHPAEFRHGEAPLPETEAGRAGVSIEAIHRFEDFTQIAEKYRLSLMVGLITGWMSGRLFVPPAMESRNVLTDPVALMWQVRFVQYFVQHFQHTPCIAAWDLGNECNAMAPVPNREAAWQWTVTIVNSIRAIDRSRPIVSGMHSLSPQGEWTMQDQGELTDVLTTHPYPVFTPHCDQDPVNTIRPLLHATSESSFYRDLGNTPCCAEEIGTLGPMVASDAVAADFVRTSLFSLWAHDLRGLLWWCASDQTHLSHAPYDWHAMERELGLLRVDGTPKPVLKEIGKFRTFIEDLPIKQLPQATKEAVCILSDHQEQWGVAFSSFILAKQAGFDIEYQYETQTLKPSNFYMLPCISGHRVIHRRRYLELMAHVRAGATLYISYAGGFMSQFEELTGLRVLTRARRDGPEFLTLDGLDKEFSLPLKGDFKLACTITRGTVLGKESDGTPAWTVAPYGKGMVYFLGFPLELQLANTPGVFHTQDAAPYWKLYQAMAKPLIDTRIVRKAPTPSSAMLGLTEHPLDETHRCVILINYSPEPIQAELTLAPGWGVDQVWRGTPQDVNTVRKGIPTAMRWPIAKNEAVFFIISRPHTEE